MRKLDKDFEKMFHNQYKGIVDYVRTHDEIFLGIRNNYINLYVDGGSFLKLSFDKNTKKCKGSIDRKYFDGKYIKEPEVLKDINGKTIENINDWINIFDDLVLDIKKYQNGCYDKNLKTKREKIIQQKLVKEFNKKSDFFAYDIEYVIEGLNDYVYNSNHEPIFEKKPRTLGRADIMLISKPQKSKIKVYFMEVKEGNGAFGGVLANNSKDKYAPTFGSGIVGHFKNNVEIINCARKGTEFKSQYRNKRFKIREILLEEIKYALHFYTTFKLIKNPYFANLSDKEIEKIDISEEKDSVNLVFFLGNYKDKESFENYLGIGNGKHSNYSVKRLLDNKMSKEINLEYIKTKDLFDFKVLKTEKDYKSNDYNLDIENYDEIKAKAFKDE